MRKLLAWSLLVALLAVTLAACSSGPTPPGKPDEDGPKPPAPDLPGNALSIDALTVTPSFVLEGGSVLVEFRVSNATNTATPATTAALRLGRTARSTGAVDAVLADLPLPALAPGEAHEVSRTVELGATPVGAYFMWAVAGAGESAGRGSVPLGVALPSCEAPAEPVTISDAGLREGLREALGNPGGLTCAGLKGLASFSQSGAVSGRAITSLEGIQHAANLTELDLRAHLKLTDLTPIQSLTGLTSLRLSNNDIRDVAALSQLTQLTTLDLSWNYQLQDALPLKYLTNLRELNLYYLPGAGDTFRDLVPHLTRLTDLNLGSSNVPDIEMLRGITGLERLNVGWNPLASLQPLAGLTGLTELDVTKTGAANLAPLAALVNLTDLSAASNELSDLSPLSGMTELRELDASRNQLTNISGLGGLTKLAVLDLSHNADLADIGPLAALTSLTDLGLGETAVSNIDALKDLPNLRTIGLAENFVTDIAVLTSLPALEEVDLDYNCLDRTPGSEASQVVTELRNRGVDVQWTFQKRPDECN